MWSWNLPVIHSRSLVRTAMSLLSAFLDDSASFGVMTAEYSLSVTYHSSHVFLLLRRLRNTKYGNIMYLYRYQKYLLSSVFTFQGPTTAVDYIAKLKQIGLPKKQSELNERFKHFSSVTSRFMVISRFIPSPNPAPQVEHSVG